MDEAKVKYIAFVGCAVAPSSPLGSTLTLLTLHRTKIDDDSIMRTHHRLLMGISFSDIILSTALMLGPLPMPPEKTTGLPSSWAHGNTATCTAQGFFVQLGCASFAYSFMLMLCYVLVIRHNVQEATIATRIEPFMHAIPMLFFGASAIAGIVLQVFNPGATVCWVAAWPRDCEEDPMVECQRGGDCVTFYGFFFSVIPIIVLTFLLVLALSIVAWTVFQRYRQSGRFVFRGSTGSNPGARQTRQVIVQCLLYGLSFVNVMLWGAVGTIFMWAGKDCNTLGEHFWITALSVFFFPLQGLFNFLIFVRPRYLRKRKSYPENSRWRAFR